MKKFNLILITLFFLIYNFSFATTNFNSDPKLFITELVNSSVNTLANKDLTKSEKENFIKEVALNNVDINALSLYTLGEIRKTLEKDVLANYKNVFEKYFLKTLTSRLTEYSSNKFEIVSAEKKSSNYTIVKSKIVGSPSQPEIKIDWRVYTKNSDKPLIRDLIVEGLSLARTQKEEFASILSSNNNDVNILIIKLEQFVVND